MMTVHLRINDAATGQPMPVRLRITGPDGEYFAPFGRLAEFATGKNEDVGGNLWLNRERWCSIDGACEIQLPSGVPLRIQALKGPELTPLDETVTLGPGQMALRFAVARWSNVREQGWHPGDTRVHFTTPHTAALDAASEDVGVVNLLACEQRIPGLDGHTYPTQTNLTAFSGQSLALQTDSTLVAVNTLNIHPVLGRVALLHSHRVVYPLSFGGADHSDDWSVSDWCDQCHRKNGLTVWVEPFEPEAGILGGEALVALINGKIDAIEYDGHTRKQPLIPWWYRLLNTGFAVPLVAGSGKDRNTIAIGSPRTYACISNEPLTYTNWINAVRAGRCFVTNGPMMTFHVDDAQPGGRINLSNPEQSLKIRASAESLFRFDKLEVVANGEVIATAPSAARAGRWDATLELEYAAVQSGWLAARCSGPAGLLAPKQPLFAHTSPVYVTVANRPQALRPLPVQLLRQAVEATRNWIDEHGRFADEKAKAKLLRYCEEAVGKLDTANIR